MDKNAIKKYAIWARRELVERVSQKAQRYGISKDNVIDASSDSVNGILLSTDEKKQRSTLIRHINEKGYEEVMEEAAYIWFNRFIALRFMEVNGYMPTHIRVFTDENNEFKPQILTEAINLEIEGLDIEKVYELKDSNQSEELFKYLVITQCNALSSILPGMFEKISDYTELLFPDNLLRKGSMIEQMIALIPEADWMDQVQIIGWLYQYYNSEKKDEVFAALKKNVKITKENIPAATQLFTPDWIVRYMVENSLGRLWLEGHPDAKGQLLPTEDEQAAYAAGNRSSEDTKWHYYLEEAEQEPEVQAQLEEIRKEYAEITPEQIKVIDPCCGSGHILAYMFDVLVQIYESYGYTSREAVAGIVVNNIYGLDIDDRAAQLAYFSVMMKARQYDRRFFSRGIQPHVYAIEESNGINREQLNHLGAGLSDIEKNSAKMQIEGLLDNLKDAKEYGSILNVDDCDWDLLRRFVSESGAESQFSLEYIGIDQTVEHLLRLIDVGEVLEQKYDVVVTNPPYMGNGGMSAKLSDFVKKNYPDSKGDMSTVCMERTLTMCKSNGYMAMINIPVWMFLSSYEELRRSLLSKNTFVNMLHLGRGVFGSDFGTTSFVIKNGNHAEYIGTYRRLFRKQGAVDSVDTKEIWFFDEIGCFISKQNRYFDIPGTPIAYWVSSRFIECFQNQAISDIAQARLGMATASNDRFLRLWHEVSFNRIGFKIKDRDEAQLSKKKFFPYNKGGEFRKWYGNRDYVVNWENDGFEIRNFKDEKTGRIRSHNYNLDFIFREGITWTFLSSSKFSSRYYEKGFLCDAVGCGLYAATKDILYIEALLCSSVTDYILNVLNPSISYQPGNIGSIPLCVSDGNRHTIEELADKCISNSKQDWDSYETSWDYKKNPLIRSVSTISEAFCQWENESESRFNQLKANEEKLNRIFIDIYGLQDELTPEVDDKDVTVRKADLGRDIRSFISYAVGCMFGRYSLDVEGLAYAGGEWDAEKYKSFPADEDNIIPICDDEYFEDDIVGRFVDFVEVVYGKETLDENLKFIADAIGGKGQPKDVIREYFIKDFYKDHCKIYQKRPIYWLFDSGKKGGFKCLIYMHRYQPDTIARIRTDYVHEQQARYRTSLADLQTRIANADTKEKVKLNKQLNKVNDQMEEIRAYEEKIHHLADQMIPINLDDGVKHNYAIFHDVLAKIK